MPQESTTPAAEFLAKEMDRAYTSLDHHYNLLVQVVLVVTGLGGVLNAFFFSNSTMNDELKIGFVLLSPLSIVGLFGAVIILLYQIGFFIYFIRFLSERLQNILGVEGPLAYYDKQSFASIFQSPRRGNRFFSRLRTGIVLVPLLLFVAIILFGFDYLYTQDHLLGLAFIIFYTLCFIILLAGCVNLVTQLPASYESYIQLYASNDSNPLDYQSKRLIPTVGFFNFVLPRPVDFFTKAPLFFVGAIFAAINGHVQYHPDLVSVVFSPPYPNEIWGTIVFLMLWFFVQEILVQQAKYTWNDIRDRASNKFIPANQSRPLNTNPISSFTYIGLLVRWGGGIILAYFISPEMLDFAIIFSLLQVFYDLWVKPNASKYQTLPMFVVATGTALRFASGAVAMGWSLADPLQLFFCVCMYILGIVYSATMWQTEAKYLKEEKKEKRIPRGQSRYFRRYGKVWLVSSSITLALLFGVTLPLWFNNLTASASPFNNLSPHFLLFVLLSVCLLGATAICYLLGRVIQHISTLLKGTTTKQMRLGFATLVAISVIFIVVGLALYSSSNSVFQNLRFVQAFLIALFIILAILQYWKITYEEFFGLNLKANLPTFLSGIVYYLFTANSGIKLKHIIGSIFLLNSKEFSVKIAAYAGLPKLDSQ